MDKEKSIKISNSLNQYTGTDRVKNRQDWAT